MAIWKDKFIKPNKYSRPQTKLTAVRKIVMHWTANFGATANGHYNYFNTLSGRYASAHLFVDKIEALCIVPLNEITYHANDGTYKGVPELKPNANFLSIGIELCVEKDGSFHPDTLKRAMQVAFELCEIYKLDPLTDIVRHYDVTHKSCPSPWVQNASLFTGFKNDVKKLATPKPVVAVDPHKNHSAIAGKSVVQYDKMASFVKSINPKAVDIDAIAKAFVTVGEKYGIRGDVAFCQAIIETSWFKFDGGTAVTPDQHNYCGMGVTQKGLKGSSFATVSEGVTGHIQHLFGYASKAVLPTGEKLLDPRFHLVTRGIAPHWEDLSNRWAMNADYGKHILALYKQLGEFKYVAPKPVVAVVAKPTPAPAPVAKPVVAPKPVAKPKSHTVKQGETFYSISKKYGMTSDELQKLNPRVKSGELQIGDVIHLISIPVSVAPKPKPKPVTKPTIKKLSFHRTLAKGSKGNDVKALQEALNKLNFKVGIVDGSFGSKTEDAVMRFQKVYLSGEVDGLAGKNTISKINNLLK